MHRKDYPPSVTSAVFGTFAREKYKKTTYIILPKCVKIYIIEIILDRTA